MSNVCYVPDLVDSTSIVTANSATGGTCAVLLPIVKPGITTIEFPAWVNDLFTPVDLQAHQLVQRQPSVGVTVSLEGPLNSYGDWDSCWRLFAFDRSCLLRSVGRCLTGLSLNCAGQVFSFNLIGVDYVFRVAHITPSTSPTSGATVKSITPVPASVQKLPPSANPVTFNDVLPAWKKSTTVLVHGVPLDWVPTAHPAAWHALDLHVSNPSPDDLSRILESLTDTVQDLIVWGIDCVPHQSIMALLKLRRDVRIVLVAHALINVDSQIVSFVPIDCVIALTRTAAVDVKAAPLPPLPDVSRIPLSAMETANTYFIVPLTNPSAVAPFSKLLPNLSSPKLLIHGPSQSGKSTLAQWIAGTIARSHPGINIVEINASALFSKYLGSSEKNLQKLFRKAGIASPSVVVIEGVHTLCPSRMNDEDDGETGVGDTYNRMLATFLMCLDGLDTRGNGVSVIGTSLLPPEQLDPAAIRPGRLETWISLPANNV